MKQNGFTLIEFMLCCAFVIGILSVISIPAYLEFKCRHDHKQCTAAQLRRGLDKQSTRVSDVDYNYDRQCREKFGPLMQYSDGWCFNSKSGEQHKLDGTQ